jgi:hypothetical protein
LELLNRVDYRLVESVADREEIYQLRYRAYLNEGAIEPRGDRRLADRFDDMPNSWIFGVYLDGLLCSSIRVSVSTPEMPLIPSAVTFPDVLESEIALGKIIVDPNRFVADPVRAVKLPELAYLTVRLGYVACEYFHADIGLAAVRAEHQAFYRRVFMHDVLCPPRPYPTLTKPISLTGVRYASVREKIFQRYPIFRSTLFERRMLYGRQPEQVSPAFIPSPESAVSQVNQVNQVNQANKVSHVSMAPAAASRQERATAVNGASR